MEISYEREADAVYIRFMKGAFDRNRKLDDCTILDLDKDGKVLGIELLEVSKRFPEATELHLKNITVAA